MKKIFSPKLLKILKRIATVVICIFLALIALVMTINSIVLIKTGRQVYRTPSDVSIADYDCILVLGAGIVRDRPSDMLADRLNIAIELYKNGVAPKILVSGDHGQEDYDEVNVMKNYCIENGVKSEDVFMDHAGFSTYESVWRAKEIFGVKKMVIATQEYHLYRAIYIADALDIDAIGVDAALRGYRREIWRTSRELMARCKDFGMSIIKPEPTCVGEKISLDGNGDITNDKT